jgi:hypothetical protein
VKILSPLFAASYLGVCFDHIYATKILFEVWQLPPIALWWPAADGYDPTYKREQF